jgi:hypothetical protein
MNKNEKEGNKPNNVNTRVVVLTILDFHNLLTKTNGEVLRRYRNIFLPIYFSFSLEMSMFTSRIQRYTIDAQNLPLKWHPRSLLEA